MKNLKSVLLIAGLFTSVALGQNEKAAVPLDLDRFVKSSTDQKPQEEENSNLKTPPRAKRKSDRRGITEVSVDVSRQFLTNGRGTWDEASLGVIHKFSPRNVLYASYSETQRFGERDRMAMVGLYQPLNEKWTLLVEGRASPTHRVLAKWSALAQIERSFGKGWIGHAGYRRTDVANSKVNVAKIGVEKYWGLNRAAYSLSINNLENTGTSSSQRIQYNRYYSDELSTVGISFAAGREIENTGSNSVIQSDIYNITISGKHAFSRRWAAAYGYTFHKQGDIYSRQGLKLGLRFKF
jgi:YaiO family outer membrane protein